MPKNDLIRRSDIHLRDGDPCVFFCNACGARTLIDKSLMTVYGREWRCCSMECVDEIKWRDTLAMMDKPYQRHSKVERRKQSSFYTRSPTGVKTYARGHVNVDGIAQGWVFDERRGPLTRS
jgi:hypothetical protein